MLRAFSIAMAAALAAQAQKAPAPELAPLVPPKAPWLKKNQKPAAAKKALKKKKPPAAATTAKKPAPLPLPLPLPSQPPAPQPAQAQQLPLPPLAPLMPPPPLLKSVSDTGIAVQGIDGALASRVAEGLRGVAKLSPTARNAPVLEKPSPACDAACWAEQGAAQKVDQILLATVSGGALEVQLIDVAAKKAVASAASAADAAGLTASAEALGCRLLQAADCTGEVSVDAEGVAVQLDGKPLEKRAPVGVHTLTARAGTKSAQRAIAVTREGAPTVYARVVGGAPVFLDAPPARAVAVPIAAAAAAAAPAPAPLAARRRWTKPAGYTALALGAATAAVGVYFGARSKSQIDQAESGFRANGGAYTSADASLLSSGNSKARGANALFVAAGVFAAAGAVLTFAF